MKALARFAPALLFLFTSITAASQLSAQSAGKPVPMCTASQLSLGTDAENGSFDGMSHGGTLLVLRNLGSGACRVEAFPEVTFNDAKGPVTVKLTVPGGKFMHPGPVMIPAIVAAGAEATSSMRWVSGPVFDPGVCFHVTSVAVKIGSEKQQSPLLATICGPNAANVSVEKTRFAIDPTYKP